MKWRKLGNVYCPCEGEPYSHAMFPVVEILDESAGLLRIYYTHRDASNYGFPTYLEGRLEGERFEIVYNHQEPIMERGAIGDFDDSGVNVTSLVRVSGRRRFYYYGWNLGVTVPFRNAIGVAEEVGDGRAIVLRRLFRGPILDRAPLFPGLCATPCVLKEEDRFKAYFTQGNPWILRDGKPSVSCCIAYAESEDGIAWTRQTEPALRNLSTDHVVTTPFVVQADGIYKMWYSYRGEKYRIGYAESRDGRSFTRKDSEVGITVSSEGWDSEMVCYPKVFQLRGVDHMIYCGNSYGRTGFGLAVREVAA